MSRNYLNILILILIVVILGCKNNRQLSCSSDKINNSVCNSEIKRKLLIQDILKNNDIITLVDKDTIVQNRYNYLRTDHFVNSGEVFYGMVKTSSFPKGKDSIKVISISKDSIINNDVSVINVVIENINFDSTHIFLKVEYYVHNQFISTRSKYEYNFNSQSCEWIRTRINFEIF